MLRWELIEIIEQDGKLIEATIYRPLDLPETEPHEYELPLNTGGDAKQLIRAVLFDGFELVNHTALVLPDGAVQKHWVFRLQIVN